MIYLFTGTSQFLIDRKIASWKKAFIEKYSDFNLIHIRDINNVGSDFLAENLLASAFLGDKKLLIIDDFFKKTSKDDEDDHSKNLNDFILNLLPNVPEETILILSSISILKTSKLYKWIKENAKIEEFNIKDDIDLKNNLQKIYPDQIDSRALDLLISYKAGDIYKIVNEIDKLLLSSSFIDISLIEKNVVPELEQNIFPLIDDFLNLNKKLFFAKLDIILQRNSYFQFYWSFLSNLRFYPFVYKLKSDGYASKKIIDELGLGNRGFLVDKNYRVSEEKILSVYIDLVNLDLQMKSGDFIGSAEEDFRFELEKVLLNYFD